MSIENYYHSINKYKDLLEINPSQLTRTERCVIWCEKIWIPDGICGQFSKTVEGITDCSACPFFPKHCTHKNSHQNFEKSTLGQIKIALYNGNDAEYHRLIKYLISCMNQHKSKFKEK